MQLLPTHHLREDEHPVPRLLEPPQQLVQQHHLSAGQDQAINHAAVALGAAVTLLSTLGAEQGEEQGAWQA